ncbi:MAG: hypothetical protein ACTHOB_18045 [Ginsengibacter sp.]
MTFEQKKDLIDLGIFFQINDLIALDNILLSRNVHPDVSLKGKDLLKSLEQILLVSYGSEIDEDQKIKLYYYYRNIKLEMESILDNEQEDEEDEENEESIYNAADRKEIQKQKPFVDKAAGMTIKELTNEILLFIKIQMPDLLYKGFDRTIINKLALLYREKNQILNWNLLPDGIYRKTERAIDNLKEELRKEISNFQKTNIQLYADNFENWLIKNKIYKKTKQNFKSFLKQNDIKIDQFLIEKILTYKSQAV